MKRFFGISLVMLLSLGSMFATDSGKKIFSVGSAITSSNTKIELNDLKSKSQAIDFLSVDFKIIRPSNFAFKMHSDIGVAISDEKNLFIDDDEDFNEAGTKFSFLLGPGYNFINNEKSTLGLYALAGISTQYYEVDYLSCSYEIMFAAILLGLDVDYNIKLSTRFGLNAGCTFAVNAGGKFNYKYEGKYFSFSEDSDIKFGGHSISPRFGLSWTF